MTTATVTVSGAACPGQAILRFRIVPSLDKPLQPVQLYKLECSADSTPALVQCQYSETFFLLLFSTTGTLVAREQAASMPWARHCALWTSHRRTQQRSHPTSPTRRFHNMQIRGGGGELRCMTNVVQMFKCSGTMTANADELPQ